MILNLSILGWTHTIACMLALALGPLAFFARRGGPAHRRFGQAYLVSMLLVNLTALRIYSRHMFWFPHWFAVTALVSIAVAFVSVRFKWPRRGWIFFHLTGMLTSYYVLIGGGVNEVFLRILPLRRVAEATDGRAIGLTHLGVMLFFAALILGTNVMTARSRLRAARAQRLPTLPRGAAARAGVS